MRREITVSTTGDTNAMVICEIKRFVKGKRSVRNRAISQSDLNVREKIFRVGGGETGRCFKQNRANRLTVAFWKDHSRNYNQMTAVPSLLIISLRPLGSEPLDPIFNEKMPTASPASSALWAGNKSLLGHDIFTSLSVS
jgi:hypothetical protein